MASLPGQLVEGRVHAGDGAGQPLGLGQERAHAGLAALGRDRLGAPAGGGHERVEAPQPLALGQQVGLLALARPDRLDLLELEAQQVELAVAGALALLQLFERAAQLLHPPVRGGEPVAQLAMGGAPEAVEQLELRRGEREPAVLVLAEERDQVAPERPQVGHRCRAALHEGARAAVRADAAREHDLVQVRADALEQVRERGVPEQLRGRLEHALHIRLAGSGPHDAGARLAAHEEVERVGEHRLAGARLAGDHREAPPGRSSARSMSSRFSMRSSRSMAQVYQRLPTERAARGPLSRTDGRTCRAGVCRKSLPWAERAAPTGGAGGC